MEKLPTLPVMPLSCRPSLVLAGWGAFGKTKDNRLLRYQMHDIWGLHLYTYRAHLMINGERVELSPGTASITPPHSCLEWHLRGFSRHACALFTFPSTAEAGVRLPCLLRLGEKFAHFVSLVERMGAAMPVNRSRAEAMLWNMLWDMAEEYGQPGEAGQARHSALDAAIRHIAAHGHEELTVPAVAKAAGVSEPHLLRLFRQSLGMTIAGYIRQHRMELARNLLIHTTKPVKAVAREVGLPDLQHFYKTVRREYGLTPIGLRQGKSRRVHA